MNKKTFAMRHVSCIRAAASRADNKRTETRKMSRFFTTGILLSSADENPLVDRGGPSLGRSSEDDNIFFQVSKDRLIESQQFNQITNPTEEPATPATGTPVGYHASLSPKYLLSDYPFGL